MPLLPRRSALLLLLPGSCAAPPPPPPQLILSLDGGAGQNPDAAGRPAPVAIHLFYLTATAKFERADVFALTERERETLGADSAGSEQFIIAPGETRTLERAPKPGVQALGVVALFRDVDAGARWRVVQPVAASGPTRIRVRTDRNALIATAMAGK